MSKISITEKKLLGAKVQRKREALNLTKQEFARKICVTPGFITHIESGRRYVGAQTARDMARLFGESVEDFLDTTKD